MARHLPLKSETSGREIEVRLCDLGYPAVIAGRTGLVLASAQVRLSAIGFKATVMVEIKKKATRILRDPGSYDQVRMWARTARGLERRAYRDELIKARMPTCLIARLTGYKDRGLRMRARILGAEPMHWSWGRSAKR